MLATFFVHLGFSIYSADVNGKLVSNYYSLSKTSRNTYNFFATNKQYRLNNMDPLSLSSDNKQPTQRDLQYLLMFWDLLTSYM